MNLGFIQTILTLVFGIVAIASIIVAIRLAKRKKPVWAYQTTKIIGLGSDAPPELKLVFDNREVPEVYRTSVIFFNKGNETIRHGDVTDEIKIRLEDAELLRNPYPTILSNAHNEVDAVLLNNSSFRIDFRYLDHNDGTLIEAIHTKCDRIECEGNIMGAGVPRYIGEFTPYAPQGLLANVIACLSLFGVVIYTLCDSASKGENIVVPVVFLIIFITVILAFSWRSFRFMKFPSWSRPDRRKSNQT